MTEKKREVHPKHKSYSRCLNAKIVIFASIIALIILIVGLYLYGYWQNKLQQAKIESLQKQVADLHVELSEKTVQDSTFISSAKMQLLLFQKQLQDDQKSIDNLHNSVENNDKSIAKISERISAISPTESNNWLISEANYLVSLAGRKIWQDQDYITARLLLKSANKNLAATRDSSLLPARQAINQDLTALAQISQVDLDGIIFQLISLANQVSSLPLVKNYDQIGSTRKEHDDSFAEKPLSSSENENTPVLSLPAQLKQWSHQFNAGLTKFMRQFIEIEKYNEFTDCVIKAGDDRNTIRQCRLYRGLITPEQSLYLRENIRLQLYIASQAAIRHQNDIYQQALKDVSTWIYAYFDLHNPTTYAFMEDIEELQKQSITHEHVPSSLKSASVLDKIMQTRIRSLLTAN